MVYFAQYQDIQKTNEDRVLILDRFVNSLVKEVQESYFLEDCSELTEDWFVKLEVTWILLSLQL